MTRAQTAIGYFEHKIFAQIQFFDAWNVVEQPTAGHVAHVAHHVCVGHEFHGREQTKIVLRPEISRCAWHFEQRPWHIAKNVTTLHAVTQSARPQRHILLQREAQLTVMIRRIAHCVVAIFAHQADNRVFRTQMLTMKKSFERAFVVGKTQRGSHRSGFHVLQIYVILHKRHRIVGKKIDTAPIER